MAASVKAANTLLFFRNLDRISPSSKKFLVDFHTFLIVRNAVTIGQAAAAMLAKKDFKPRRKGPEKDGQKLRKRQVPIRSERLESSKVDWSDVVQVAESYNPSLVPIPVRMGRIRDRRTGDPQPFAVNNIELLKIPNFLHLTPPAIEKQCKALQALCTPWPENAGHRPLRYTTYNFIYPGPSIYHPDSRRVKLQVYLKDLELDDHARRKMIILAGTRYNPGNDELTLVEDRCPTRKQNKDYVTYLLTSLYDESVKTEVWEHESAEKVKRMTPAELRRLTEGILNDKPEVPKGQKGEVKRVVGNRVIRFNDQGRAFVYEMRKRGIVGPPDKSLKEDIEQEWRKIEGERS